MRKMPQIRLLRHPTMRKMPQTQFRKQQEMHRTQRIQPRKPHRTLKMRRMRRKTPQYSVPFTDLVRPVGGRRLIRSSDKRTPRCWFVAANANLFFGRKKDLFGSGTCFMLAATGASASKPSTVGA
jgi:hypothetical protein